MPDHLRAQVSEALLASKLTKSPEDPDDEWLGELVEVTARDVLSNQGYFKERTEIAPYLEKAERCTQFYSASVWVEAGPQYRLGKIGFRAELFSEVRLKGQTQIKPGDIFDVSKIHASFEAIHKIYCRLGYIDSTLVPAMDLDDVKDLIDLTIEVEEGKQYRVNSVEILGLERSVETLLRAQINIQKGDIFDSPSFQEVVKKNQTLLSSSTSLEKLISVYRDTRDGNVDVVIDYQ